MAPRRWADVLSWILRVFVAIVLFQAVYSKFTGASASVHVFETVGRWLGAANLMEPYGRFAIGAIEIVAGALLLLPISTLLGSVLALLVVSGAIFFHLFADLGVTVVVGGVSDGGLMFGLAVAVALASVGEIAISMQSQD